MATVAQLTSSCSFSSSAAVACHVRGKWCCGVRLCGVFCHRRSLFLHPLAARGKCVVCTYPLGHALFMLQSLLSLCRKTDWRKTLVFLTWMLLKNRIWIKWVSHCNQQLLTTRSERTPCPCSPAVCSFFLSFRKTSRKERTLPRATSWLRVACCCCRLLCSRIA